MGHQREQPGRARLRTAGAATCLGLAIGLAALAMATATAGIGRGHPRRSATLAASRPPAHAAGQYSCAATGAATVQVSAAPVMVAASGSCGYWVATADGSVTPFGTAPDLGSLAGIRLNWPVLGMVATVTGRGYWLVAGDGGIFSFGDASFYGSTGDLHLNWPVVGMGATPTGHGYWLVAGDGGIFSFGDAGFYGSTGNLRLNRPVVGMAAAPAGDGYWLVAGDGGVFSFASAGFYGSTGDIHLNKPVIGMTSSPDGRGYRFVASDGGVFSFGDAAFLGSLGNMALNAPVSAMAPTPTGNGYWLLGADGGIFTFGDAPYLGRVVAPVVVPPPPPPPGDVSDYVFWNVLPNGTPSHWNPCRPITVSYVYVAGAPYVDVAGAVARLGQATGLVLQLVSGQPSDITITFAPSLSNGYIGFTQDSFDINGWIIQATVTLSMQTPATYLHEDLQHELGHAVGLGHAPRRGQVMDPIMNGAPDYQAGDLSGLRLLGPAGSGACRP